ncbi:MAG: hypothetical protein ACR2PZ_04060 [Pseudomonadales bacterium]
MSSTHWTRGLRLTWSVAFLTMILAGCSDGGGSPRQVLAAADVAVAGSVGDGPVINADLSFIDAKGNLIGQATSDDQANYEFVVPQRTPLPVRIVASGGTDLVTGRPLDFDLVGVLGEDAGAQRNTLNLSPLSTITVRAVECTGGRFNKKRLDKTWVQIRDRVGMGLDKDRLANPMFDGITTDNVADVVLSSEALAEAIRRTTTALTNAGFDLDAAAVFEKIACDLAVDKRLDGNGKEADSRVSAVFRTASAAVMLETMAGRLEVDNQDATSLMDAAIAQILPEAAGQTVRSVAPSSELQSLLLEDLLLLQSQHDDPELLELIATLSRLTPEQLQAGVDDGLSDRSMQALRSVTDSVALADEVQHAELAQNMVAQAEQPAPYVSFFPSQSRIIRDEPLSLSWATSGADRCVASGAWSGEKQLNDTETVASLSASADFLLTCYSAGGSNTATVNVVVIDGSGDEIPGEPNPEPGPTPVPSPSPENPQEPNPAPSPALDVTLRASQTTVQPGESVQLTWSSDQATSCQAGGGWTGARSLDGSAAVGPLNASTTFELTCSNSESSSKAIVGVQVLGEVALTVRWTPPTENEDGTAIESLTAFKVYYGQTPGQYTGEYLVDDANAESVVLSLPRATYYLAMTAIDGDGVESDLSNEIRKESL